MRRFFRSRTVTDCLFFLLILGIALALSFALSAVNDDNNPFAMAVPVKGEQPLVLDVACSVTARGNISNCKKEGKQIPLGWAIDAEGNPTTEPDKALVGAVLPFAGHKGSGIAIMVDILCGILNGGVASKHVREDKSCGPNVGHTMIAIDIAAFDDPAAFDERIKAFMKELKEVRKGCNSKTREDSDCNKRKGGR